jgi:hypothetical protein
MANDYTQQITELLDSLLKQYQPGGTYETAQEAGLTAQKKKFLGETEQSLAGRGLSGTTAGAGAGERWEREVGAPSRLSTQDIMSSRTAGLATAKAGYLQGAQQLEQQKELAYLPALTAAANRSSANAATADAQLYAGTGWDPNKLGGGASNLNLGGGSSQVSIPGIQYTSSLGGDGNSPGTGVNVLDDYLKGAEMFTAEGGTGIYAGNNTYAKGTVADSNLTGLKSAAQGGATPTGNGQEYQGPSTGTPGETYIMRDGKKVGVRIGGTKAYFTNPM